MSLLAFLANFYRSLEPESPVCQALDDDTATTTFLNLIDCCIKDFGFDRVLYQLGELSTAAFAWVPVGAEVISPFSTNRSRVGEY